MEYVNTKTLIGEIVKKYPQTIEILLSKGMHCLGCPASQAEALEDACSVHGINSVELAEELNRKIAESK